MPDEQQLRSMCLQWALGAASNGEGTVIIAVTDVIDNARLFYEFITEQKRGTIQ